MLPTIETIAVNACIVVIIAGLSTAWHEAGHYLAARMLGLPVTFVRIGIGPALTRGRLRIHLLPATGEVYIEDKYIRSVSDFRLLIAGGLGASLVFAVLVAVPCSRTFWNDWAVATLPGGPSFTRALACTRFAVVWLGVSALLNAVPFRLGAKRSDGHLALYGMRPLVTAG